MEKVRLGKTGLMVSRIAMGCIPIQRLTENAAVELLHYAFDHGVNFYDTAHVYTDSEAKLGTAFSGHRREHVVIASKTMSTTYQTTVDQLDESLRRLKMDYIDIYQWHNPENGFENFQNERGPYQAMQDAQKAGKIRFLGVSQHNPARAKFAIDSGAFDTLQFPLSVLSSQAEIDLTFDCVKHDVGVIAMKAMCGGLLSDGRLPFLFLNQYRHIVPIWGLETIRELDQFLQLSQNPEPFTDAMQAEMEELRKELGDEFCRGCGYCLPCPVGITLPIAMRMASFHKRGMFHGSLFSQQRLEEMQRIDRCRHCGECVSRCPYHLDVPRLLKKQQAAYMMLHAENASSNARSSCDFRRC
ncbi:MAG: aldo/keto reductase [Planctomycetaceae bacterium]|nr:aldo/keto reductase [Planctomycetaceae bacterium]